MQEYIYDILVFGKHNSYIASHIPSKSTSSIQHEILQFLKYFIAYNYAV